VWGDGHDPSWQIVGSGRFDGNADTDLLFQNRSTGQLVLWPMQGFTRLTPVYLDDYLTDVNDWVTATGDFNRDGMTDLIWRHQTQQACVKYWLMTAGSAALVPPTKAVEGCVANAPADFNWQIVSPK
jgi:hypothetical protein